MLRWWNISASLGLGAGAHLHLLLPLPKDPESWVQMEGGPPGSENHLKSQQSDLFYCEHTHHKIEPKSFKMTPPYLSYRCIVFKASNSRRRNAVILSAMA